MARNRLHPIPHPPRALAATYDEAFVARLAADNRCVLDVWAST